MASHPEVLLIPLLMLFDYFLTVLGARLAEHGYRRHFKFPDYELNPAFQKSIAAKKWFSPKHIIAVVLVAAYCAFWYHWWQGDDPVFEGCFGAFLTVFITVIGGHLANIWTFYFMLRYPDQVSGEVILTQRYVLHLTRSRMLMLLLPLAASAVVVRAPFLLGAVAGALALILIQTLWIWRNSRRKPRPGPR